jgi:restriction system protein
MGRRKKSGLDELAGMPWPVGAVLGVIAFLTIRYGLGAYFSASNNGVLQGMGKQLSAGAFTPLAWMALALCWIGAAASYVRGKHRKRLLDTQTGLESVRALSWREFEMLVGEAFRRQGYVVEETGLGGADGGIDLVLRSNGRTELVQCKQWRNAQVKPNVVREMWGLRSHHNADGIKIVCVGDYTRDAAAFAEGKAIELISGERLLQMINNVRSSNGQAPSPAAASVAPEAAAAPLCPSCTAAMVRRTNRANGQSFWGCTLYPRCKGTRPA